MAKYYLLNRKLLKDRQAKYYESIKKDPAIYEAHIEAERIRKRLKFGWKRTYKKRVKPKGL